jgi:hypothetical protein
MRRSAVQGAARRTQTQVPAPRVPHRAFRRVSKNTPAAHSSGRSRVQLIGEYCRIHGRTYCPGATIRASIWGIPIQTERFSWWNWTNKIMLLLPYPVKAGKLR